MLQKTGILAVALLLLAVIGTVGISELEEQDQFCTGCHLMPEETYHARSQSAMVTEDPFELVDLAGYHYWDDSAFRCVDCHRGNDSIAHRATVLALAAGDTLTWALGREDQTIEKGNIANPDPNTSEWAGPERYNRRPEILNASCLKCHGETLTLVGFDNHFHNKLPAAQDAYAESGQLFFPAEWGTEINDANLLQAEDTVLTCLDCHRAHVQGFESDYFLNRNEVLFPGCVQCHQEAGKGPLDLAN